jgi:alcohol dehydrogenase YqhD (iron-dependent ADH family)
MNENVSRFVRFAVNVMGVANDYTDAEGTALRGIEAMERFYRAIGMPTCISELLGRTLTDAELDQLASQCSKGGTITIGGFKVLHEADMRKVYALANY